MQHSEKYITNNRGETQKLGEKIAKGILKLKPQKSAIVLALHGDLGAGKTTFAQGFAKGLGIKEKILSPTFVLVKKFQIPNSKSKPSFKSQNSKKANMLNFSNVQKVEHRYFYHVDCYRLKDEKDLDVLELKRIISNPKNIIAIEWPEKTKRILPQNVILIKFKHLQNKSRKLVIN